LLRRLEIDTPEIKEKGKQKKKGEDDDSDHVKEELMSRVRPTILKF
jgi:hypothetical protein